MSSVRHSPPGKKIPIVTIHHSPPQISWINDYVPHSPHLKFWLMSIFIIVLSKKGSLKKKDSLKKNLYNHFTSIEGKIHQTNN